MGFAVARPQEATIIGSLAGRTITTATWLPGIEAAILELDDGRVIVLSSTGYNDDTSGVTAEVYASKEDVPWWRRVAPASDVMR